EEFCPTAAGLLPPSPYPRREMLLDALGDKELRILGPTVEALAEADLLVAQGLAMSLGSVLLVRRTIADVAIQDNKCGAALRLTECLQGVLDAVNVVGVANAQDIPPITQEPGRNVFRKGNAGVPLNGDMVIVVNPTQVVQAQMAGE